MPSPTHSTTRARKVEKGPPASSGDDQHSDTQGVSAEAPPVTSTSISAGTAARAQLFSLLAALREVWFLFAGFILPNLFRPLLAIERLSPGIASMWPFNGSSSFSPARIPSLADKVILVTGGNNGIGKETVLQLARHGPAKIYLAARTESKALAAIRDIKAQLVAGVGGGGSSHTDADANVDVDVDVDIEHLPLDLTSLSSIQSAANHVKSRSARLDILILNAGIMATPPGTTEAGHDTQLATNHIGHFQLTTALLPLLTATTTAADAGDVRVLSLASEAHNLAPPLDTILSTPRLVTTNPWTRYGASKAANILFAAELARRYPQLTSVSLHPGVINTDLYLPGSRGNPIVRVASRVFGALVFRSVRDGALNTLWAAAGVKRGDLVNGAYYTPVGKERENRWVRDVEGGRRLWEWTERELKSAGY